MGHVLPKEHMVLQLGQIDLLMAMYSSDDSISMDTASSELLETLRDWCESDEETIPRFTEDCIAMLLSLEISDTDNSPQDTKPLQLRLSIPLVQDGNLLDDTEPPPVRTRIQQPGWMSKGQVARLNTEIPDQDVLSVIEHIKDAAAQHLAESKQADATLSDMPDTDTSTVRVWFYFPSISTRSKRDDIVHYAPSYGLSGFLLAGKPGVLCLEGGSSAIDDFMKFIKTESWGDIPSQHKKVSERYREADATRAFGDMREVTDMIGERRGERANRNDMKALEAWLNESGLGEAFAKVIM